MVGQVPNRILEVPAVARSARGTDFSAEIGEVLHRRRGEVKCLAEMVGVADDMEIGVRSEGDE